MKDVQCRVKHRVIRWMAATLDGVVAGTGAVYEAKFMLPWSFSEEFAAETPGSPTPSVGCGTRRGRKPVHGALARYAATTVVRAGIIVRCRIGFVLQRGALRCHFPRFSI
jgi:hypothetical protein